MSLSPTEILQRRILREAGLERTHRDEVAMTCVCVGTLKPECEVHGFLVKDEPLPPLAPDEQLAVEMFEAGLER